MKRILLIFIALFVLSPNTVLADCKSDKKTELLRHDLNVQMGTDKTAKYKTDQLYIDILAAEKTNLNQPLPQNKKIGCTTSGEYAHGGEIPSEKLSTECINFIAENAAKDKYIEQLCADEQKTTNPAAQQPSTTPPPSTSTSQMSESSVSSETPATTSTSTETSGNTTPASTDDKDNKTKNESSSDVSGGNDKTSCTELGGTWVDGGCKIAKHSDEEIAKLKENAAAMRANEQSAANKAIGAAGIAGVGLGAMQMASGMAEQNADAAAEEDMRAYLQTFSCRYGNGLSVRGGETNIELPGQPDLLPLYTEYVNLANDIKVRKAALDMQPGIEAESILDSATTGLYDNVGIGKTGGVFASLSRALMDPNGPDAQRWAEQKEESSKKKNTGLQIAGVALIGTAIASAAANAKAPKESSDKITSDYHDNREYYDITAILNQLQIAINAIPSQNPSGINCPSDATGTYADCKCNDKNKYYAADNTCQPCGTNEVPTSNGRACTCADGYFGSSGNCTKISGATAIQTAQNCKLSGNYIYYDNNTGVCSCMNTFTETNNTCVCNLGYIDAKTNKCTTKPAGSITTSEYKKVILPNESLFDFNQSTVREEAKQPLIDFANSLIKYDNCSVEIHGFTDPVGSAQYNANLSMQRAQAIHDFIQTNVTMPSGKQLYPVDIYGRGETNCDCTVGTDEDRQKYTACKNKNQYSHPLGADDVYPPCRRVEIIAECTTNSTTTTTTGGGANKPVESTTSPQSGKKQPTSNQSTADPGTSTPQTSSDNNTATLTYTNSTLNVCYTEMCTLAGGKCQNNKCMCGNLDLPNGKKCSCLGTICTYK